MTTEFTPSPGSTIGMEMEFQLVDADSFSLVDGVLPLLDLYPDSEFIKSEFVQTTIEVASKPCDNVAMLKSNVQGLVSDVVRNSRSLNMRLCGAGTHPFSKHLALITPMPRYLAMEKAFGYISHSQITFATHVHIGVSSGNEAVLLMSELKPYLPLLIALSANSPYWRGHETGFAAYRQRILASSRSYGMPPDFEDWQAFLRFLDTSYRGGIFESINDIHWDIRPRPHLGTVEVRIMDAQSTVSAAVALAAFIRCLVAFLRATRDDGNDLRPCRALPWWAQKDNCFNASRGGMDAQIVCTEQGDLTPLGDLATETLEILMAQANDDAEQHCLEQLTAVIARPPYQRQLDIGQNCGLEVVVRTLSEELCA